MPTSEEIDLLKRIRREIAKKAVDAGRLEITLIKGHIHFAGVVNPVRNAIGVSTKQEMADVIGVMQRWEGIKSIVNDSRMIEKEAKHKSGPDEVVGM